jgi:WD40 repeat protein
MRSSLLHAPFVSTLLFAAGALALTGAARAQDGAPPFQWVGGGQYDMSAIDATPGGAMLATSSFTDGTIKLWSGNDGGFVRTLTGAAGGVQDVAFSPDAQKVITGGEVVFGGSTSAVLLWDVATASVIRQLTPANNQVFSVAWSPDGTLVAAGDQANAVRLWNASTGALVKTLQAPGFGGAFDIAFSPDGTRLLAGYGDNKARIWNIAAGTIQFTLTGHTFFVQAVAWSPNGTRVATGSWDNTIRTWNASTGVLEHVLNGHTDIVHAVSFSPDNATLASGSWDHTIRLWNAASGAALQTFNATDFGSVNGLRYTSDGSHLVAGGIGSGGFVLAAASGAVQATVGHHHANIHAVVFSGDQTRLISGSGDMDARVWDAATGTDLMTFTGHDDVVNCADMDDDGVLAVTGSGSPPPDTLDTTIRTWTTANGQQQLVLPGHVGGTTFVALTADAQTILSAGRDGLVKHWNADSGALTGSFNSGAGSIEQGALSPDESTLAVTGNTVRLLNPTSGALLHTLAIPGGTHASSLRFSPDGTRLLVGLEGFGGNLFLFDVASGLLVRSFSGDPDGFVQDVAFSPDGHTVACGSGYSRTVRTFSADDGTALKLYDKETGWGPFPLMALNYSADGRLAIGRADATVVMSECEGLIETYGVGCPGSGGFVPALGASGCATAGGALTLSISGGLGGANAFLLLGLGQGSLPLKGCTLLVNPLLPVMVSLTLPGSGAGNGALTLPSILPTNLPDGIITLQAWVHDAGAAKGFASSNGVQLTIE